MSDSTSVPSSTSASECSVAKIEANRANARKSTGPTTSTGKIISAHNARSHGIFAADVMPGEDRLEYAMLHFELVYRFLPQDRMEMAIVERIVQSVWRQRRVQQAMHFLNEANAARLVGKYREEVEDGHYDTEYVAPDKITPEVRARRDELIRETTAALRHPATTLGALLTVDDGALDRLLKYEQRLEGTIRSAMKDLKFLRECQQLQTGTSGLASAARVLKTTPYLPETMAALEEELDEEPGENGDPETDRSGADLQNEPTGVGRDEAGATTPVDRSDGPNGSDVQNEPTGGAGPSPEPELLSYVLRPTPRPAIDPALIDAANLRPEEAIPEKLRHPYTLELINEWFDERLRQ